MPDEGNEFLNPDEIEALLNTARDDEDSVPEQPPASPPEPSGEEPSAEGPGFLDPKNMDALLQQREAGRQPAKGSSAGQFDEMRPDDVLDQAQAHLGQAMAGSIQMPDPTAKFGAPAAFAFEPFDGGQPAARPPRGKQPLEILQDVELDLRIELGRTELLIEEVVALKEGSVVTLDKLAGDPVDILVNGRLIARGEVLVLNDNFCVRVAEILTPDG